MERFIIISNSGKDKGFRAAEGIRDVIIKKGGDCRVFGEFAREEDVPADTQCAIILGGDGTFIQAANDLVHMGIPMLGINLGTLGFLTEVERQNTETAIDCLFQDKCRIESRMMLEGSIFSASGKECRSVSLNDIVISRSTLGNMNCCELSVNGEFIDRYLGDGIIVATPTGSTAYNLSAGGPILTPQIKAMVISPICPHSLNKRSLVVSSDDEVGIRIGQCRPGQVDDAAIVFDGRMTAVLHSGDFVMIRRAGVETRVVKMPETNFYEILRNKLGGERRSVYENRPTGENYRAD